MELLIGTLLTSFLSLLLYGANSIVTLGTFLSGLFFAVFSF